MTDLVSPGDIEGIVGVPRHPGAHIGRAISANETFYILHSQSCLDSGIDLRECVFSVALDKGIDPELWSEWFDRPVLTVIYRNQLVPVHRMDSNG